MTINRDVREFPEVTAMTDNVNNDRHDVWRYFLLTQ